MTLAPLPPATPSDAPPCHAVDGQGRTYTVTQSEIVVEWSRGRAVRRLDVPGDPVHAGLPRIDLDDGRALRRVVFERWAENLGAKLSAGAVWETTYLARRPYHTLFGMLGGVLVGAGSLTALVAWATSDPQVRHEPGLVGGLVLLAGVALLLWIAYATLSSAARFWLTRGGSYVRIDGRGVTLARGERPRPASDVAAAVHHPWLRVTEIRLRDGTRVWVPRENGPLVRLDLVLATLPGGPPVVE